MELLFWSRQKTREGVKSRRVVFFWNLRRSGKSWKSKIKRRKREARAEALERRIDEYYVFMIWSRPSKKRGGKIKRRPRRNRWKNNKSRRPRRKRGGKIKGRPRNKSRRDEASARIRRRKRRGGAKRGDGARRRVEFFRSLTGSRKSWGPKLRRRKGIIGLLLRRRRKKEKTFIWMKPYFNLRTWTYNI